MKKKLSSSILALSMVFNSAPSINSMTEVFAETSVDSAIAINDNIDIVGEIYNSFASTFGTPVEMSLDSVDSDTSLEAVTTIFSVVYGQVEFDSVLADIEAEFSFSDAVTTGTLSITSYSDFEIKGLGDGSVTTGFIPASDGYAFTVSLKDASSQGGSVTFADIEFTLDVEALPLGWGSNGTGTKPTTVTLASSASFDDELDDLLNIVSGDEADFDWAVSGGTITDAGTYTFNLTVDGASSDNYSFGSVSKTESIELKVSFGNAGDNTGTPDNSFVAVTGINSSIDGAKIETATTFTVTETLLPAAPSVDVVSWTFAGGTFDDSSNIFTAGVTSGTFAATATVTGGKGSEEDFVKTFSFSIYKTVTAGDVSTAVSDLAGAPNLDSLVAASDGTNINFGSSDNTIEFGFDAAKEDLFLEALVNGSVTITVEEDTVLADADVAASADSILDDFNIASSADFDVASEVITFEATGVEFPTMEFKFTITPPGDGKVAVLGVFNSSNQLTSIVERTQPTQQTRVEDTVTFSYKATGDESISVITVAEPEEAVPEDFTFNSLIMAINGVNEAISGSAITLSWYLNGGDVSVLNYTDNDGSFTTAYSVATASVDATYKSSSTGYVDNNKVNPGFDFTPAGFIDFDLKLEDTDGNSITLSDYAVTFANAVTMTIEGITGSDLEFYHVTKTSGSYEAVPLATTDANPAKSYIIGDGDAHELSLTSFSGLLWGTSTKSAVPTAPEPTVTSPSTTTSTSGNTYSSAAYHDSGSVRVNGTYITELRNVLVGELVNLNNITSVNGRDVIAWYYDEAMTQEITNPSQFVITSDVIANGLFAKVSGSVSETLPDGSTNAGAGNTTGSGSNYVPSVVPSTFAKILNKLF